MKRSILAIAFVAFSVATFAQTNNEKKAQKILNKVSKSYKSLKSLKASFEIQLSEPGAKSVSSQKGTLYLKGDKFKVEMPGQEIISDGKTQWFYTKDVNEVQITDYKPNDNEISPTNIFTIYDRGFKYQWVEEKNENGQMVDVVELVPKAGQDKKDFTKIKLSIDKMAKQILSSEIIYRSGRKVRYFINQQVPNINLADTFFNFEPIKYRGIEIVELREGK